MRMGASKVMVSIAQTQPIGLTKVKDVRIDRQSPRTHLRVHDERFQNPYGG
jgi:hypothetical protein